MRVSPPTPSIPMLLPLQLPPLAPPSLIHTFVTPCILKIVEEKEERKLKRTPLTDLDLLQSNTHYIISYTEFAKMKDGVVIVNTARGAVIDEDALVQALDSGKVLSAGLDVFEEEPKIHPGLLRNSNVMLVPHMGTWTVEVGTPLHLILNCYVSSLATLRLMIPTLVFSSFHTVPTAHSPTPANHPTSRVGKERDRE